MLAATLTGIVTALVVVMPQYLHVNFPEFGWGSPVLILGVGLVAILFQKFSQTFLSEGPRYDGLADLFVHIHSPSVADSFITWNLRGIISFLLVVFGGCVGPEGAAVEFSQALIMRFRTRSARWFEEKRRTDAATSLAGGVSAAFGAPFSGMLLPIELGVGGRSLHVAVSALTAFVLQRFLARWFFPEFLDLGGVLSEFNFFAQSSWREWINTGLIGISCGVSGAVLIHFFSYTHDSLLSLFRTRNWMRVMAAALMLAMLFFIYRPVQVLPWNQFEQLLWSKKAVPEVIFFLLTQTLSLSLVLSGFGTIGVFWPLLVLGGGVGYCSSFWMGHSVTDFTAVGSLVGASAFWGAVLGAPWTGAVLAFELSQNFSILLPCVVAGLLANSIRRFFRTPSLIAKNLETRGVPLSGGRSSVVLDGISIRDAMVSDYEVVHEQEPLVELYGRIQKARYPFLPVVNSEGVYLGLLTIDMIQEGWHAREGIATGPLSKLVEAKDLLYSTGFKAPTVQVNEKVSQIPHLFEDIPCLPVLGEDRKIQGLLFVHNLRLAYDREMARRALPFKNPPRK